MVALSRSVLEPEALGPMATLPVSFVVPSLMADLVPARLPMMNVAYPLACPRLQLPTAGTAQLPPPLGSTVTARVMGHSVCRPACPPLPLLSVAVNMTTRVPISAAVGLQEKVLLIGLPLVGKFGVMVAPAGSPAAFEVTICPASGSDARMVKLRLVPTGIGVVEPHVSVGGSLSKTGGLQF